MCDQHISFRAGRSCTDRIFALRIIVKKFLELQLNLILCFLDFEEKCLTLATVHSEWLDMRTVAVGKGCVFFPFLFCIEMVG